MSAEAENNVETLVEKQKNESDTTVAPSVATSTPEKIKEESVGTDEAKEKEGGEKKNPGLGDKKKPPKNWTKKTKKKKSSKPEEAFMGDPKSWPTLVEANHSPVPKTGIVPSESQDKTTPVEPVESQQAESEKAAEDSSEKTPEETQAKKPAQQQGLSQGQGQKKKKANWVPFKEAIPSSPPQRGGSSRGDRSNSGGRRGGRDGSREGGREGRDTGKEGGREGRDGREGGRSGGNNSERGYRQSNTNYRQPNRGRGRGSYNYVNYPKQDNSQHGPHRHPFYPKDNYMRMQMNDQSWLPLSIPLEPEELKEALIKQIEYYFSIDNLVRDTYLRMQMSDQGWLPLSVIAGFNRVKALTTDTKLIAEALKSSSFIETSDLGIRRKDDWALWVFPPRVNSPSQTQNATAANGGAGFSDDKLGALVIVTQSSSPGEPKALTAEIISALNEGLCFYEQKRKGEVAEESKENQQRIFRENDSGKPFTVGWFLDTTNPSEEPTTDPQPFPAFQHPSLPLFHENGFIHQKYSNFKTKSLQERSTLGSGQSPSMNTLFHFWSNFLRTHFDNNMYNELRTYASEDARNNSRYGLESLFRFYSSDLQNNFRKNLYYDFQEETIKDFRAGNKFGLEKFWTFWKNHKNEQPLEINSELKQELEKYQSISDFQTSK